MIKKLDVFVGNGLLIVVTGKSNNEIAYTSFSKMGSDKDDKTDLGCVSSCNTVCIRFAFIEMINDGYSKVDKTIHTI